MSSPSCSASSRCRRSVAVDSSGRSVDPAVAALPLLLAQGELPDLAARGLGQRAELHGIGTLEVGDLAAAERDQLALGRDRSVLEGDERLGALAPALVRHRHDGALEDGGVTADDLLDLD